MEISHSMSRIVPGPLPSDLDDPTLEEQAFEIGKSA